MRPSRRLRQRLLATFTVTATVVTVAIGSVTLASTGASAADVPRQDFTCGMLGLAADGLSGSDSGDYSINAEDPVTIQVNNTNVFPAGVMVTPEGGTPIGVSVPGISWKLQPGVRTITLPSTGSSSSPWIHKGTISGVSMMNEAGDSTLQTVAYVHSPLCNFQRRIASITQVAGTGVMPASGAGSISFKVKLSAQAPAIVKSHNDGSFDLQVWQTNAANTTCGPSRYGITFNPGETEKVFTFPVPAGTPSGPIYYGIFGSTNHLPYPGLAAGTVVNSSVTTPPATAPPVVKAPTSAPVARVSARTTTTLTLTWNAVAAATGYHIYETGQAVRTASGTSYTVTGLGSATKHDFQLAANNSVGDGPRSAVSGTTLPTYTWRVDSQTIKDAGGNTVDLGNLRPGQRATVTLGVTNTGTAIWSNTGANPVRLGTSAPNDRPSLLRAPEWLGTTRPAAISSASAGRNATTTITFPVQAADAAGTWSEQFNLVSENAQWFTGAAVTLTFTIKPVVGLARSATGGYWTTARDGGVFSYEGAQFYGSMGGRPLNAPVVGIAATPSGKGYWLAAADGGVFAYGDAGFYGSMAGKSLNQPVVGIAASASGKGYWLTAADGGVFAYGDAPFRGAMAGKPLNKPVVGIASTPANGYWLTAADGGVFAYGAGFYGSMASKPLNAPVTGITGTSTGAGYWLVAADGGIFAYGDAAFYGSLGGTGTPHRVRAVATLPGGRGYSVAASDGTVTTFKPSGVFSFLRADGTTWGVPFAGATSAERPFAIDTNGDGKQELAVYNNGRFTIRRDDGSYWGVTIPGGTTAETPLAIDTNGDGKQELAVYNNGRFTIMKDDYATLWGVTFAGATNNEKPFVIDTNGDGKQELAVYNNGRFTIRRDDGSYWGVTIPGGTTAETPLAIDTNGDGKQELAVYNNGRFTFMKDDYATLWGVTFPGAAPADRPLVVDTNGDRIQEPAVYHPGS